MASRSAYGNRHQAAALFLPPRTIINEETVVSARPTASIDDLHLEFYQISPAILESFPRFRLPMNLYLFKEQILRLVPYYTAQQRISPEFRQELEDNSAEGLIFVSRQDHPVYVKHIGKQLDLVLLDPHLKAAEIAMVFQQALTERLNDFLQQPVAPVFEKLRTDILVLTQYLWQDNHRIKEIAKLAWPEHSLARHGVNVGFIGLALYMRLNAGKLTRKYLDQAALGLFLHDTGMSKVPAFILQKTKPLTRDEQAKIMEHCFVGARILQGLDVRDDPVLKQALEHQERLDGKGYPQRLTDRQISVWGQLCAVADSFCAMTSKRTYAQARTPADALNELIQHPGYNTKMVRSLQALLLT